MVINMSNKKSKNKSSTKLIIQHNVLGLKISQIRISKDISQNAVANSVGMCPKAYRHIENGESIPTLRKLTKIADVLDISLSYLFEGLELEFVLSEND